MQETILKSVVWEEGNHFVAQCIVVDVSSFGDTREEAIQNLDEALALYFESDRRSGCTRPRITADCKS